MTRNPQAAPEPVATGTVTAIENELPAYRAISTTAILSLILGLVSVCSVVSFWFAIAGVAAVVLGILAEWKIRRYPDVLTGRKLARIGIAVSLLSIISAVTTSTVTDLIVRRQATQFANQYIRTLKEGSLDDVIFYSVPLSMRQGKTPQATVATARETLDPEVFQEVFGGPLQVKERLTAAPNEQVRFVRIEKALIEDMLPHVTILVEFTKPGDQDLPDTQRYALLDLMGADMAATHWRVKTIVHPYTPDSFVIQPKPVDDGHGHGHAH